MSSHPPPGTPADDDERARLGDTQPGGRPVPANDQDAPVVPVRPPPSGPPPVYGSPPPPSAPPPGQLPPASSPINPTTPYQPVSPPAYGAPNAPPPYGGYPPQSPPVYGGTQPLPRQDAPPAYGSPPLTTGYGAPSGTYLLPSQTPPKKRGGLVGGIIAAVVAIILIATGIFFVTRKSGGTSATTTPALTVVSGVPAVTATAASAPTASTTTATATVVTALPTQAGIGNLQGTLAAAATGTASVSRGASGTAGTPATAATPAAATARAASTATRTVSASSGFATASRAAGSPTVGQGGLPPTPTGSARPGTAAATSSVALGQTWTDPNGRIKLQYPNGWRATRAANSQNNLVEIVSPDASGLSIDLYRRIGTPADEVQTIEDSLQSNTQFVVTFGTVTDIQIGGEMGKSVTYTEKRRDQPNSAGTDGVIWVVNHGTNAYLFDASDIGTHRAEIDAILATVVFT